MGNTRYCLCCGEQVPFNTLERHGKREVTCAYCGFTLDIEKLHEPERIEEAGYALVTDDSNYTRKIIEDLIREKKVSSAVLSFENGLELISAYSKLLAEKKAIRIAVIDISMPVMDGLTAARTMRVLEAQHNAERVPIVFFSAVKADQSLREEMESLAPANYVNKGSDPDPNKLIDRVDHLLTYLIEEYGASS